MILDDLLTVDELAEVCAIKPGVAEMWLPGILEAALAFNITTPKRMAAFLAQIAHESGRFRYVREIWGPTDAQKRYEGRKDLGNTEPGDGKRFMGRGLIQITGRANYVKAAKALGVECVRTPSILEQPRFAVMSAAWFWDSHGLNKLADDGNFVAITKKINGGLNGYQDRVGFYERARKVLGVDA